jgi:hypothetical protein
MLRIFYVMVPVDITGHQIQLWVSFFNSTILGSLRSERNSILLFAYGSVSGSASAVGNSLVVVTQTTVPQDPIPYNGGTVWFSYLNQPTGLFVDTIVALTGSAWIDSGPDGAPYNFDSYILSYSAGSNPNFWIPMGISSANEVHNGFLGNLEYQWVGTGRL